VSATSAPRAVRPGWLWLSLPITVLALAGSLAGILVGDVYAEETADWAGQAVGQDIGNLLLYPLLLGLAYLAARGSLRAYLVCRSGHRHRRRCRRPRAMDAALGLDSDRARRGAPWR
jgi:tetrahydromethanopterin S-methyltransferase subunit G